MQLISLAEEIDIEQEVVIAILDSVLRIRGTEKAFAKKVGVTPVYLSYVRNNRRTPRVRTAEKIARALPLTTVQQDAWLYHVRRIWELKSYMRRQLQVEVRDRPVEELVEEIKQAHGTATFAQDPALARARYREVEISADQLLRSISPNQDPINYIELCFLMHEALSVLNRNDEALWYGKRSRLVAESIDDPQDYRLDRERLDFFLINSMRAEAVAFHNLKLYRDAFRLCQMAEETDAMKRTSSFWKPHLYRDTINALEGIPRFSITHVENLSHQVRQICETRNEGADGLLSFLILGSLARAYIKHQNFKDAQHVLTMGFDRLSTTANLGPLHLVIFFRMYARLYSARGDYGSEWEYFAQRASDLASQAGLEHQLSEMCAEFGVHYEKVKLLSDEHLTR